MAITVVSSAAQRQAVLAAVRCAAAGHVVSVSDGPQVLAEASLLAIVDEETAARALQILKDASSKAKVVILARGLEPTLIRLALAHPRVVGIIGSEAPEPWELTYITRRILTPAEPVPQSSQFMTWGVANVGWNPKSSSDMRRIVGQIEDIARSLGCERKEANIVGSAAHELLMNAIYDAPVDTRGQPLYAFDRTREVQLAEPQRPVFRLAVGPDAIGLDVSDPFGRLPRTRFFESVLRGQDGEPPIDSSHGGAGLGLYTLLATGSVLRAELRPLKQTHVSWMLRRGLPQRAKSTERSLYFVPLMEAR